MNKNKKLEHTGIRIELIGHIGFFLKMIDFHYIEKFFLFIKNFDIFMKKWCMTQNKVLIL